MTYKVVVGVDGSPHSEAALRWAVSEAAEHGGEVLAVLAWQMPFVSIPGGFGREELEQSYKDYLVHAVREAAPSPAVPLTSVVAEGEPIESLIEAAKDAHLLVLGTKGHSRYAGLMLGSVSAACAANAPCPVVLIRRDVVEPSLPQSATAR
jgi:nucleotide-binding universal stress UspA family protein